MNKISPCLWFDNDAEDAAHFYCSIFPHSSIKETSYYGEGAPKPAGTVLVITFVLNGQEFMALNGGPEFPMSPAVSFLVDCQDQAEVDHYWERLSNGGSEGRCGWVTDRFGVSWQIVPKLLGQLLQDDDREKAHRVMNAMLQMNKLDCSVLQNAFDQE